MQLEWGGILVRHVSSKWLKTLALLKHPKMKTYVPQTVKMSKPSLLTMLEKYEMVYIKPVTGTFGLGVMRVEKIATQSGTKYKYQSGTKARVFDTYEGMYESIRKASKGKRYLAQQGIHLLKYKGRRFDIRVMVQKDNKGKWYTTGLIGRVAHPGKIVTNYHAGGKPMAVEVLLQSYMSGTSQKAYLSKLAAIGTSVARQIHKKFPGVAEIGVDIAMDSSFKPWILEVNTSPDPYIFNQLKDKTTYRRVIRFHRQLKGKPIRKR